PEQWTAVLGEAVAQAPAGRPVEIVLFGGAGDRPLCEKIAATVGPTLRREAAWRNEAGRKSLAESVLLLDTLDRFVCIDSGLLHFARLLGVPCESYWGPTAPATLLRDFDPALDTVRYAPLPCSPCVHITNTPPCLGNNLCIKRLTDPALRAVVNPGWLLPSGSVRAAQGNLL
ncbi:MAG TPA: glycosyltransferase family 9 protein, partial [Candidatus Methylacidiphilales bacterium]